MPFHQPIASTSLTIDLWQRRRLGSVDQRLAANHKYFDFALFGEALQHIKADTFRIQQLGDSLYL